MRPVLIIGSIAGIAAGTVIVVHIGSFLHGSSVHGAALIRQERRAIAAAGGHRGACRGAVASRVGSPANLAPRYPLSRVRPDSRAAPRGLLEAPTLSLVAPVEEGTSNAVLNDAVGHVRASTWPGHPGTSVFSAHDVTWFSGIDRLNPGDVIRYVSLCRTYTYRVSAHRVVHAGYPVYNTAVPSLVLVTCYPLDALYPTSDRYLVYATLATTSPSSPVPLHQVGPPRLTVPAPRALAMQGLGLRRNEAPLGTLRLAGSPAPAWSEANAPLQAEAAALAAYFGVLRSAEQGRRDWWVDLAPSVSASAAAGLWGWELTGYDSHLDVRLRVQGDRTLGAELTATVTTSGTARPGTYHLTVTETVSSGHRLLVSGFRLRPAS